MPLPSSWRIEPLNRSHDRAGFDCGEAALNSYLQRYARQNASAGIGLTFVAVSDDDPTVILGYFTVSASRIEREEMPTDLKKLPHYPIPTLLLARLAVDSKMHGLGLGALLLRDVLKRALTLADEAGFWGVEVDALHDRAAEFYARYGFQALQDSPLHLVLSFDIVRKTLATD